MSKSTDTAIASSAAASRQVVCATPQADEPQMRTVIGLLGAILALLALGGLLIWSLRMTPVRAATPAAAAAGSAPTGLFFHSGRAAADGEPESFAEAPLLASEVSISVSGLVSRVTVRQHFHNPTDAWLEGIYVFPLPDTSAVDRLNMRVGARRIEGRILERAEAKQVYEAAAAAGQRASLVSAERPNVFTTAVANIGPGEDITIEIEYQDSVAYDSGRFSLRFPMVVAPRYSPRGQDQAETVGLDPANDVSGEPVGRELFGPVRRNDASGQRSIHNPLTLEVSLTAGLPLDDIESLYHDVSIESLEGGEQRITLSHDAVPADRDFVLEWAARDKAAPRAALYAEEIDGDSYLMVMLLPPSATPHDAPRQPRDVTLVVDTSGSMHGASMEQAKAAVLQALRRLDPDDRFNVIRFDSETQALFPDLEPATTDNVAWAWHYIDAFEADGGTEMLPALVRALRGRPDPQRLSQVVFITDGSVANEAELFGVIAERLADTRLFPVGIGSAPNSYFMRKAAETGRGSFVHIGDVAEVGTHMTALLRKLENPVLTGVTTGWPISAGKTVEIYPARVPDLYHGEPVVFSARLEGVSLDELQGHLLVSGRSGHGNWQRRLQLETLTRAPGVAAIWARAKLNDIEDALHRGVAAESVRAQSLAVALEHGMVTRYTSLVAVDDEVARPPEEDLQAREISRNLPHGWNYDAVFGGQDPTRKDRAMLQGLLRHSAADPVVPGAALQLPRGATPAALQVVIGVASALLGLVLLLMLMHRRWLDDV